MYRTLIIFLLSLNLIFAQKLFKREVDNLLTPREHPLDFIELKLEIAFEPKQGLVKGKVTHIFTPLRTKVDNFFLDAKDGLIIKDAQINGVNIEFKRDSAGYTFYPAQEVLFGNKYSLVLNYEARPKRGLYFVGWNDSTNVAKKQIWSQGQGIENRNWIPMYDEMNDKIISEVQVTFDKKYKVLSNGAKLSEKENSDGTKTWKYRMQMPHAPYLIMIGIGEYEIKEIKSKSGVPIRLYYYPEHKDRVDVIYKYTDKMVDFFEKEFGVPYAWKTTYSQIPVQDYMYGAMENTTATVFTDYYCVDARAYLDRNYVGTNAHELVHMWFGDLITARSASDTWLQESFATHYQWVFDREVFGQDQFDWNRKQAINQAIAASNTDKKAIAHSEGGSTRWYPKGAFVIEMLKNQVGKEQFNRVIKYYLEKYGYKNVDSHEFLLAFHDVLGISLNWFWDEWIYKGGEPAFKVHWQDMKNSKNERVTEIKIEQTHEINDMVGLFKVPIKIEVFYKDGTKDTSKTIMENTFHTVAINNKNNVDVDFVLFDPNAQIMKSVVFNKYLDEWMNQALRAPYMLDRYDAVVALKGVDIGKKRDVLISTYMKEKFHAVKSEIISQLANDTAKSTFDLLKRAINDKDANVRKAVITNIQNISPELETELRKLLKDSSYVAIELTLEKLAFKFPENTNTYLEITKSEFGNNNKNVRIKWLEIACINEKSKYIDELIAYSSQSYEFRTRTNAIEALKKLNHLDDKVVTNLANAAAHFNSRLYTVAGDAIQYFYKQSAQKRLIVDYLKKSNISSKERQALVRNMK
ncbi:MAG: M1 family metallopeptidase [Bacteroidota bacterium]|nr:M1 family metallopeptidase [Bacteroidota bacterium]